MCLELKRFCTPDFEVTPADLEAMLALLGIDAIADTITTYWSREEQLAVFDWALLQMAAARCQDLMVTIPPVPAVLVPFIAASKAVDA